MRRPCAALAHLCKSESTEFHLLSPRQGDSTAVKVDRLTADVSLINKNCEQEEEVVMPLALTASPVAPQVSLNHNGAGIIWMGTHVLPISREKAIPCYTALEFIFVRNE